MRHIRYPFCCLLTVVIASWAITYPAAAADTASPQKGAVVKSGGQSKVQARFVRDFSEFAGSDANAQSLYNGLRAGTRITLSSPAADGGTASTVTFNPPTRALGNGSAYISLALGKQQLANYGITDPTPQQIHAALTGGIIVAADPVVQPVELKGILAQRASGMGWGAIAKASGMNLGRVVSNMRSGKTVNSNATGGSVTTGFGTRAQSRSGTIAGGQAMSSRGVVNAAGRPVGAGINTQGGGHAGGVGAGIATGNGVTPVRADNPPGQGKGLIRQ